MTLPLQNIQNTLNDFSKISMEEMGAVKLMDRVETKFILSQKQLSEVLKEIKADYRVVDIFGNLIPPYKTVYFDTDDYYFYHEHHRKRNSRYKVRFRNYVDSNITFLEVKYKKNGRIDKKRIKVENEQFVIDAGKENFLKSSNIEKQGLQLKISNTYDRITLVSKHSVERVTLDLNVRFESDTSTSSLDNVVIAELKQPKIDRTTTIYETLRRFQIKPYNISKYCIGLIKTKKEESIKYNRFKKKLIRINKINQL